MSYSSSTIDWAHQWATCWRCGKRGIWPTILVIHHLVRGSSRKADDLATTCIACNLCHTDEHDGHGLGLLGWLVLKRRHDPTHYDLVHVNRRRGRADGAITEADVDAEEARMRANGH